MELSVVEFAIYNATTNQYVGNTQGATSGNGALQASAAWNIYENWGKQGFPSTTFHQMLPISSW